MVAGDRRWRTLRFGFFFDFLHGMAKSTDFLRPHSKSNHFPLHIPLFCTVLTVIVPNHFLAHPSILAAFSFVVLSSCAPSIIQTLHVASFAGIIFRHVLAPILSPVISLSRLPFHRVFLQLSFPHRILTPYFLHLCTYL